MMREKKLVPKRRFEGFNDEWNSKKMKELARFSKGKGYSKRDLVPFGSPIILYGHLYTDYKSYIETVKTYAVKKENSVISQGNEIIVPSSGETAEDIARASTVGISGIILAGDLNIIKPNSTVDSLFLGLSISNSNLQKELIKRVQGSSVVHLYNSDIEEANLSYPTFKEQQKIGQLFKHFDEMIALQQRKLDKTKALKTAYLAEMFPAEGERVPKRRFEGFVGEWEVRKIEDLMNVTSVKRIHQSDWRKEGVRFIRARDIVALFKNVNVEDKLYISKEKYDNYTRLSGKVEQGDLLVTGVGTIGVPMLIVNNNPVYFKDGNIIWLQNKNKVDGYYLFYFFNTKTVQNHIKNIAGIGTVGTYTIEGGKKTPINLPSTSEQQKIGQFFKHLDEMIATHQLKLDKLKATKQAYLHEMFV